MDGIIISPNTSSGLQLLQVVVFPNKDINKYSINNYLEEFDSNLPDIQIDPIIIDSNGFDRSDEFGVLNEPRLINSRTEIMFPKTAVGKIILIFNQSTYYKSENIIDGFESNARGIYNTAKLIKSLKRLQEDSLQTLVYNMFLNKNDYKKSSKNSYKKIDSYHSYKYPSNKDRYSSLNYRDNYLYENFSMDRTGAIPTSKISALFTNVFSSVVKDDGSLINKSVFISSPTNVSSIYSFQKPMYMLNENMGNLSFSGQPNSEVKFPWKNQLLEDMLGSDNSSGYIYDFSLNGIDFYETEESENLKACFVSKKISFSGYPLAAKAKLIKNKNESNILRSNLDLKYPVSYELSICNKDIIRFEDDWIPICETGVGEITSEVLFFDQQSFTSQTRFPFKFGSLKIFKNGFLIKDNEYIISLEGKSSTITLKKLELQSIYVCSYSIDLSLHDVDSVDFFRLGILNEALVPVSNGNSSGEIFARTDSTNKIQLGNIPHVLSGVVNGLVTSTYSSLVGTIFSGSNAGYSPVKIEMEDGSYALNLTNYTGSKDFPQFPEFKQSYYFIHNGKNIIFDKPVTGKIKVYYNYLVDSLRFRLIIRKNVLEVTYPGEADLVLIKVKTQSYDPYYDKLTKVISNN